MLCRPLFLLLYQLLYQLLSIIIIPGVNSFITMLAMYWIIFLLILLLLNPPPSEYQPYKKKSRWKNWIDRKLAILSKQAHNKTFEAYLYLTARRRKFEANVKKGRQKGGSGRHYYTMRRIRALLKIIMVRTAVAVTENNKTLLRVPTSTAPPERTTALNAPSTTTLPLLTEDRSPTHSITGTTTSTVLHVQGDREVHSAGEALLSDTRVVY
jgi:hypothetical protein